MARAYNTTLEVIDGTIKSVEKAKQTALALSNTDNVNVAELFDCNNLFMIERGIINLNNHADKCWLLSSILLYSLVYDKSLYTQSGLSWQEYVSNSKKRIGMSKDDMSRSLNSARFFIAHHVELMKAGWTPQGSSFKLSFAESALELSGSLEDTIYHLVNDSWRDFHAWYKSFKSLPVIEATVDKRPDIVFTDNNIQIGGVDIISISDELPEEERSQLERYLTQIYSAIKRGEIPAIVPVYDEKEARNLVNLRDKYRQGK